VVFDAVSDCQSSGIIAIQNEHSSLLTFVALN
jgi:hypothetical protein